MKKEKIHLFGEIQEKEREKAEEKKVANMLEELRLGFAKLANRYGEKRGVRLTGARRELLTEVPFLDAEMGKKMGIPIRVSAYYSPSLTGVHRAEDVEVVNVCLGEAVRSPLEKSIYLSESNFYIERSGWHQGTGYSSLGSWVCARPYLGPLSLNEAQDLQKVHQLLKERLEVEESQSSK